MRVEFNGNNFSAEMNSSSVAPTVDIEGGKKLFKNNRTLIFGIIALAITLGNLPFGLFMNLSTEILSSFVGVGLPHWVFVLFAFSAVMLAISLICGIFSIISFAKSEKSMLDSLGLAFTVISFVMFCLCISLNIVGLTAW